MEAKLLEGTKDDAGKERFDLLPPDALFEVARVFTIGGTKYSPRNWEKGLTFGRVFAAMMRHAWKWFAGERYAQDDGQHHLASVVWCGLALLHYDLNAERYWEFDDRPSRLAEGDDTTARMLKTAGVER